MMKRFVCIMLSAVLVLTIAPCLTVQAYSGDQLGSDTITVHNPRTSKDEEITVQFIRVLPNGSKIIISEEKQESLTRAGGCISTKKQQSYINSDNVLQWRVTLSASFTYNGSTSTCTSATSSLEVFSGNWSESVNYTYAKGNTAVANVTMVRKFLFFTLETQGANLTITCDGKGKLY